MISLVGELITFQKLSISIDELLDSSPNLNTYKARQSDKFYLVKQYKSPESLSLYHSEINGSKSVGLHGRVLLLHEYKDFQSYSLIIFEYLPRLTLSSVISQEQALSDSQISTFIQDILIALYHLHLKKIVHMRVSADTVYVSSDYRFKLASFSSVCHEQELPQEISKIPEDIRPPEVIAPGLPLTPAIDIWALGCLVYKLLYRTPAFGSNIEHQARGKTRKTSTYIADYWKLLLSRLLEPNPITRAGIPEIFVLLTEGFLPKPAILESADYIKSNLSSGKSTKNWVKSATDNNSALPDQIAISRLIGKAWNKPFKIPKVFQNLQSRPIDKDIVILKSLILLHRYISLGPKSVFEIDKGCPQYLAEVEKQWKFTTRSRNSQEDFKQAIVALTDCLKSKVSAHSNTGTFGTWSDLATANPRSFETVYIYWELSLRATNILLSITEYQALKTMMAGLLAEEQQRIMMEISDLSKSNEFQVLPKYNDLKTETFRVIERIKTCFPESPLVQMFTHESSISSHSPSTGRSTEESKTFKTEEKPGRTSILISNTNLWIINPAEISKEKEIGQGSSCVVYKGTFRHTPVAIKVLKASSKSSMKEFEREVEAMLKLKHPNLILFMGATMGSEMSIVTEFCFGDTVFSLLHEKTRVQISLSQQMKIAKDTARGMAYLHASSLIHRDLKSLNLLLEEPINGPNDRIHVKITDFGISVMYEQDRMNTGQMGTCHWMAPEVLNSEGYDFSADVFSYAIVLWEIFARETPYKGLNPAMIPHKVLNLNHRPDIEKIKFAPIRALIVRCWTRNKENRPTFPEIIKALDEIKLD